MLWLWGRVHDRSPKLGYFDGSVKILFDRLIEEINVKNGQSAIVFEALGDPKASAKLIDQLKSLKMNFRLCFGKVNMLI